MNTGPVPELSKYLDLLASRQRVVASNLANIDTPGYRTADIDFHREFERALSTPDATPEVKAAEGLLTKPDGNNVSLDRENRLLAENTIRFQAASQILRTHMRQLRSAIKEGQA